MEIAGGKGKFSSCFSVLKILGFGLNLRILFYYFSYIGLNLVGVRMIFSIELP